MDSDEALATLLQMEEAPHYNAWLGRKFRPYLGHRVLEIGAGIGTITEQIAADRELLIAMEVEPRYVDRLARRFADRPNVRPYLSDVDRAAWDALSEERLDSVVLSNVLEHLQDDAGAVRNFRRVLPPEGRLVVFVPALPFLMGSLDRAVGHHRRYTPSSLRTVLENNGFRVERMEWMNLVGIPGWFLNGRVFKRRGLPPLQLKLYDRVAPLLAAAESRLSLPIGMSLLAVGRATGRHRPGVRNDVKRASP